MKDTGSLRQINAGQKAKTAAALIGVLVSLLVAVPVVITTFFVFWYGVLGGSGNLGGYGSAARPNTEWWAPLATVGVPVLALAIIVGAGVFVGKMVYRKRLGK